MLSRVSLSVILWIAALKAALSLGFPRQEYWSGLPFPPSGDLPDPGIKPESPVTPTFWQVDSLPLEPHGKPQMTVPRASHPSSLPNEFPVGNLQIVNLAL